MLPFVFPLSPPEAVELGVPGDLVLGLCFLRPIGESSTCDSAGDEMQELCVGLTGSSPTSIRDGLRLGNNF